VNSPKTLIFVPTYNERDNAPELLKQILALGLDADVLFLDDNSPDGTGQLLRELAEIENAHVSPKRKTFFNKIKDLFHAEESP